MLLLHTFDRLDLFGKNRTLGRIPEKKDLAGNLIDVLPPGAAAAGEREGDLLKRNFKAGTNEKGRKKLLKTNSERGRSRFTSYNLPFFPHFVKTHAPDFRKFSQYSGKPRSLA